jgi:hypothetical protein
LNYKYKFNKAYVLSSVFRGEQMNRKFLFLAIALIIVIAEPIVAAAVNQTQTIHVTGNAKYPHNLPPQSTPTPAPTQAANTPSVQFSLFFPNGTAFPTAVSNNEITTVVVDPMSGHNGGWIPTLVVVRNDGIVPITVNATVTNKNVPSNLDLTLNCGFYGIITGDFGADKATNQQPIQPGQTYYMSLIAFLTPNAYNYQPDQQFSYSFDVTVTATQA